MSQTQVKTQLNEYATLFESELNTYLASVSDPLVPNLHDAMRYALGADLADPAQRGKRIRPILCLLAAQTLGAQAELAMPFALSIELMHNFALVHDDMQDGDIMRRGRDSAWVRFGEAHAINIGDYLLVHATRVLTDYGPAALTGDLRLRLVKLIGFALDHTHIGQALDMNERGQRDFTMERYLRIVREKTGYYLAAPIQGGAMVAGADDATLETIGRMALLLGPLFQIIDDIIDLTDGKGRESVGSDIREGKRSYLVAHVAQQATAQQTAELFDILDKPRRATTEHDIQAVLDLYEQYGAIQAGRDYCAQLHTQAQAELAQLPKPLARALGPVFEMLVNRNK